MARLPLVASVLLSLFLLSSTHPFPTETDAALSATADPSEPAAIRLPSDKPASSAVDSFSVPLTRIDGEEASIEVSLIPIRREFPRPRVVGRSFWRRLGRHCHHHHHHHPGFPRGAVIPYGDDMIVPAEQIRRGYRGGMVFSGEAHDDRLRPMMMETIPVEELGRQREMGFPRQMRPFRRFRPEGNGEEGGLVKRFLDSLNRH